MKLGGNCKNIKPTRGGWIYVSAVQAVIGGNNYILPKKRRNEMRGLKGLPLLVLLAVVLFGCAYPTQGPGPGPSTGPAPPPRDWCEEYANISVTQNEDNHRLGCGYRGDRWHSDHWEHRNWCRRVSRHRADSMLSDRDKKLRRCRRQEHEVLCCFPSGKCKRLYKGECRSGGGREVEDCRKCRRRPKP